MKNQKMILVGLFACCLMLSCRGPEGPVGPQGPTGGTASLTDPAVKPKVIYTFPPSNTQGPYEQFYEAYNQLEVRFNKIMDRALLRRAVSLSSPHTNARIDTSRIFSYGEDVFVMYPVDSPRYYWDVRWRIGETYTLGVSSIARDVNGNYLTPAYSMTFLPEPYFRIRYVYPTGGGTDVFANAFIGITFNSPVDTSIFSKIQISPPVPGLWVLGSYDSVSISYQYQLPLRPSTSYSIIVDASARDRDGNQLPQQFLTSFTTASFRVAATSPTDGSVDVPPTSYIYFSFTSPTDTGTLRSAFSVVPATAGSLMQYYWNSAGFFFAPSPQLLPETTYTVTIDTTLRSSIGTRLSSRYQFSFRTSPLRISYTYPADGLIGIGRNPSIYVQFNARVDTATIRSSFALRDSTGSTVPGTFSFDYGFQSFYFFPGPILAPQALYTAVISTDLTSIGGSHLKSPFTFSFTTGN